MHERPELPGRDPREVEVGARGDGGRADRILVEQGDLAEVVTGAQRAALLAVDGHLRLPAEDDEEADAAVALHDDVRAGGDVPVAHLGGQPGEGLLVETREERDLLELLGRDGHAPTLPRSTSK